MPELNMIPSALANHLLIILLFLLTAPLLPALIMPGRQRRATARAAEVRARRVSTRRRLDRAAARAVDVAVATVVTAGERFAGHTVNMPCRECGQDSPPMPAECVAIESAGSGFRVVATCWECHHPIVSRELDPETAAALLERGAVDADRALAELRAELAAL